LPRLATSWKTLKDVEFATLEWVDSFSNRRLFGLIGYVPPVEFEERYYRKHSLTKDEGITLLSLH